MIECILWGVSGLAVVVQIARWAKELRPGWYVCLRCGRRVEVTFARCVGAWVLRLTYWPVAGVLTYCLSTGFFKSEVQKLAAEAGSFFVTPSGAEELAIVSAVVGGFLGAVWTLFVLGVFRDVVRGVAFPAHGKCPSCGTRRVTVFEADVRGRPERGDGTADGAEHP